MAAREPVAAAAVQRWLSIAAGEVAHGPATARMIVLFGLADDPDRAARISARILAFMDQHLAARTFLAADHVTLADLACYSYVAHARTAASTFRPIRPCGPGWRGSRASPGSRRCRISPWRARAEVAGPFHAGELAAQAAAGVDASGGAAGIRSFMPDQHREFFALLPYFFMATVDEDGWPVATVLTASRVSYRAPSHQPDRGGPAA